LIGWAFSLPTTDPEVWRIIQYGQPNCGKSTPHASDPAADMERLRLHLGVERWMMFGGSWGSTLVIAYAERHPERVSEILMSGAMLTDRETVDWLYRGVGRIFPEAWDRFRQGVPAEERDRDLVLAYSRLMENPDFEVRAKAAVDWVTWEDTVISPASSSKAVKTWDVRSVRSGNSCGTGRTRVSSSSTMPDTPAARRSVKSSARRSRSSPVGPRLSTTDNRQPPQTSPGRHDQAKRHAEGRSSAPMTHPARAAPLIPA
jgi:pimeloyl-ACP methyl ester carboxylesterase